MAGINKFFNIVRLINRGYGEYKYRILFLSVLGLLNGILEGLGVSALIPLFSLITGSIPAEDNFILKLIRGFFATLGITWSVKYLLIFVAVLFIAKALALAASAFVDLKTMTGYQERLKKRLMRAMLMADWRHLAKQKLGHLETMLMVNTSSAAALLGQLGNIAVIFSSLLVYVLVAINISPLITLVAVVIGGGIFLIIWPVFRQIKAVARELDNSNKNISHHVGENILGIKTVKAMSVEAEVTQTSEQLFTRIRELQIKQGLYGVFRGSIFQPASIILILVIFAFSYKLPGFNLASFFAVMYLVKQIFSYIEQLQKKILSVNSIVPYFQSVVAYEDKALRATEKNPGSQPFAFNKSLEFKNVQFNYQPTTEVLRDINFTVNKGEMIGLIGASGAGKTTIVDLLLRLLEPTTGQILLDGRSAEEIDLIDWRHHIGYVSQDIFLINDTLENNIRFHDATMSEQTIMAAAQMANIDDFIKQCPEGLQTVVGERGVTLSAGQRQRIIIARVLARRPQILVLDEATSALDNESELKIQEVIRSLKGKITVVAIAHRLSTIIDSDRLLILDQGRITQEGRPQDLLDDKNSYLFKVYNIRK